MNNTINMESVRNKRIGLFWLILTYQLIFLLLVTFAIDWGIFFFLESEVIRITAVELEKRNHLLQLTLEEAFINDDLVPYPGREDVLLPPQDIRIPPPTEFATEEMILRMMEDRIKVVSQMTNTRYTVISPEGSVQFDSDYSPWEIGNVKNLPEIKELLRGKEDWSTIAVREDLITGERNIYQALPLFQNGQLVGITRVSQPYVVTEELNNRFLSTIRIALAITLVILVIIVFVMVKYQTRLVTRIKQSALEIAKGNFDFPLPSTNVREFAQLVRAMGHMSGRIKKQIATIEDKNEKLNKLTLIDELTGLGNRRHFNQQMEYCWWLCLREKHPISFMLLDIDKFKNYNDTLGHPAGDTCLKKVSEILQNSVNRHTDILVRWGGEEFAILLPETDQEQACNLAVIILENINEAAIPHPTSTVASYVTISIGLASLNPPQKENWDSFITQADEALYLAKEKGRNRMEVK